MEKKEELVGDFRREDLIWLLSLSESDLEWLISLQKMVVRRAGVVGHVAFAKIFNLKMLRLMGSIVMQYVKKQDKGTSNASLSEFARLLNASNLLNCNLENGVKTIDNDDLEIDMHMLMDHKKRKFPRSSEHSSSKRLKSTVSEI